MSNDENKTDNISSVTLDDLDYFWANDGLPVFYANKHNIEDIIENLGFSIYYLICNIAEDKEVKSSFNSASTTTTYNYSNNWSSGTTTTSTSVITEKTTSVVKVVNNIVGRAVSQVTGEIADLAAVRETAEYNLPGIPLEIVNRLDDFFRLVDAQHGTESIVLLTFDPSKNDSSGWGVLVPEQTNTSVHCNYNPDSVVEEKPDNVLIVGSVHSHPGMAAYASGTDHADQADFDGVHITYGWQKSVNGGATQYYIEMQMAGSSWTLKPEDVFEGYVVNKNPDSLVVEWSTKVKKVLPPTGGSAFQAASHQSDLHKNHPHRTQTLSQQVTLGSTADGTAKDSPTRKYSTCTVPDVKDKTPHIIIAEIDPNDNDIECPSCDYALSDYDLTSGSCPVCDLPLVSMTDGYQDILAKAEKYLRERHLDGSHTIYLWTYHEEGQRNEVIKLSEQRISVKPKSAIVTEEYLPYAATDDDDEYDDIYKDGFDPDKTICCFRSISNCTCPKTVTYEDITDFEIDHRESEIYSLDDDCLKCTHQYTANCPYYYEAILAYATEGVRLIAPITRCHNFEELTFESSHLDID